MIEMPSDPEGMSVKIGRIDENVKFLLQENNEIKKTLKSHEKQHVIIERDRFWILTIAACLGSRGGIIGKFLGR